MRDSADRRTRRDPVEGVTPRLIAPQAEARLTETPLTTAPRGTA